MKNLTRIVWAMMCLLAFASQTQAQVYLLNEDFSSASGTTPPATWSNINVTGVATDLWRFNNPGNRTPAFPVTGKFAIFDSQNYSGGGGSEKAILETPYIDCSFSPNTLFFFDHQFVGGNGGLGTVEIFNGSSWSVLVTYSSSTVGVESDTFNISSIVGGITNSKFRFVWEGDSSNYWLIDNVRILAPLTRDANVEDIDGPVMPFLAGVTPVTVTLQNDGIQTLTSTTLRWTVDGVPQPDYAWTGSLSYAQEQKFIQIGTYNFPSGIIKNVKVWSVNPNGLSDQNALNDTSARPIAAALCGTYTIGGASPSFTNFTQAAFDLNNAGLACPVIFKVRNGSYNEQIKLYDIPGASATNTVLFEGENGDSTLAEIHYQLSNPSNDFTISLTGADYVSFQKMGIRRTNGTYALILQSNAHHITAQNCRLGNVMSPNTSCDSVLTFRYNNMQGFDINLQHPDAGPKANNITVEDNFLNSLVINNSLDVSVRNNRNSPDTASYAVDFTIDRSRNVNVLGNRMRRLYMTRDSSLTVSSNNIRDASNECCGDNLQGVLINETSEANISGNTIFNLVRYASKGINVINSKNTLIINNNISVRHTDGWSANCEACFSKGIYIQGSSTRGITVKSNTIQNNSQAMGYGIDVNAGDSIFIKNNIVSQVVNPSRGVGISLYNIVNILEVDSNTVIGYANEGIRSKPTTASNWKIRFNNVQNIPDVGIFAEGTGAAQYIGNRITGITAGTGIVVNGPNALIANNYIQPQGLGIAKGISLRSGGTGSSILFNSVNVTGVDIINGQALEVIGGTNYTIKNNIFANNGGGYAAYVTAPVSTFNLDYNDYYSAKRRIAFYQNTIYDTLSVFAAATGKDANSKSVNPFYTSNTNLQSNHTLLNETGTAIASVTTDIDSTLRSAMPDIGAKEFSLCADDAGVNEFWTLANPLPIGTSNIPVVLQNQGSNTLTATTIHWEVNGVAQTPFAWTGALGFRQNTVVNIGTYNFPAGSSFKLKAWTAGANGGADCNNYNDTCKVLDLGTPLCGVYTIGGVSPDFPTFYDASVALNNAGLACPVIFKVRNGSYNEQIKLYDIPGASATNTVLFEGENGDSTLAEIHYQLSNPSNDFTISLTGADYVSFQKMGIRRTNGTYALILQSNAHHITAQNCRLGNVMSPNTSCDSVLTFRYNNMQGFDINLQHPDAGPKANNITVEDNFLNSLVINNSLDVSVRNNRNSPDTASYAVDFTIDRSRNVNVLGNRMRRLYMTRDSSLTVSSNNIRDASNECCGDNLQGVLINETSEANISGNTIFNLVRYASKGINVINSKNTLIINNNISVRHTDGWSANCEACFSKGIYIQGSSTRGITVKSNTIQNNSQAMGYGIDVNAGDSIFIKNNIVSQVVNPSRGVGISLYNIVNILEVDSNTVIGYANEGIRSKPTTASNWKIRFNNVQNIPDVGIFAEGTGAAQYIGNRITGITAGTGIVVNGPNALIANNYIQPQGLGIAKGISLRSGGTGSSILFNSVNVTGVDIINGQALEVIGGTNYTIKNNIFANNGGGYAAYVTAPVSTFNLDYNDYYSAKRRIAFYQNTIYDTLSVFAAATGKDANSKSVNPFYTSNTNLQSNHTLLNETGTAIASVTTDIDSTLRSAMPDIGAKEFSLCADDAGVNEFWTLANPLPIGTSNIPVVLQNQGSNTLTATTIHWEVNGVAQTPFAWTGALGFRQNTVVNIGTYNFPAGSSFKLKAWTAGANGGADCNNYNDTCKVLDLGTPLCGVYTIGGVSPDFPTFYDASVALNNAGLACPVIFKVRNGSYNEQIKLYDIPGASATNTVLFEGENGDSTLAEIHYQLSNPSNDFTISLTGADYVSFQKMGIRRTNGTYALILQSNAHHITAQNCRLGNVMSPNTSCDSVLTFRYNNMQGFDINLQHPDAGPKANNITVEDNFLNSLVINNSLDVSVRNNRNSPDTASYAVDFTIDRSRNVNVLGNRMRRLYMTSDTTISITLNKLSNITGCCDEARGILLNLCKNSLISENTIKTYSSYYYPRAIEIQNSTFATITSNYAEAGSGSGWSMGMYIIGGNTKNVLIKSNSIKIVGAGNHCSYGIYMDGGDSIYVRKNNIDGTNFTNTGYGISSYNITTSLEVDSNYIVNFKNEGIYARPTTGSNWKIRYNNINNIQDAGIFAEGTGAAQYIGNRITGITAGTGIVVNGPNALIANNYIQPQGLGIAKGISLRSGGTGSSILFNSVNVTGIDIINGQALEVLGGTNYTIKNNIFANNGGGYAAYVPAMPLLRDWDYNCYYTPATNFGNLTGTNYSQLPLWGAAIIGDANSKKLNPFYQSTTELLPFQKQVNGAGTAAGGIFLDIDGELRNQQAPDMGAQEFMVDFGITRLISPNNTCAQNDSTPVKIYLRQFGDIPFINLKVAYQVNNGPVYIDTIPGSISNDIEYTFQDFQDLSVAGNYEFKVWLVDNGDDNINNDTIRVIRMNKPAPVVDFTFLTQCANTSVPFTGSASVTPGFIDRYEWSFGDSTYGLGQNPVHIYGLAGTYNVSLQAYSDQGCYTEVIKPVTLNATPDARFTVSTVCAENTLTINNQTVMAGGTGTISYLWDFGDGTTSTSTTPSHVYNTAGTYTILLTATSNNGCWDTLSRVVTVNPLPVLAMNLGSVYEVTDGAVALNPTPVGGILVGPGVAGQTFIPALAGVGNHVVKYFYTSPTTGCSDSLLVNVSVIPTVLAPVITTQPASLIGCEGESGALVVVATGTLPQFQWYLNGSLIPGATNDTLLIPALGLNDQGNYQVVVYNDADTLTSNTASVTVYPISFGSETVSANYSYSWNGTTYTQSGTYTYTTANYLGCDSIVTLNLTIITTCPVTVDDSFCNGKGYTLPDGSVVYSAGTYVVQIPSVTGCDSIITTNLTVNPTYNIQQQVFICPNGSYVLPDGQTINNSGIYVSNLFTSQGCDSIITTEVRFYPAVSVSIAANPWACGEGYSLNAVASGGTSPFAYLWSNGQTGNYINNLIAGTYTVTVTDANGCTAKSTRALTTPVPFRTQTQGGWGSDPSGTNVGTYLANNFLAVFPAPAYLTVGCTRRLQLTSAAAVNAFLPSSGTSKALPAGTTINPGAGLKNTFAGQVVALTLNVAFDLYDPNFGRVNYPLRDLRVVNGVFAGWTVQQVLNESNKKLGGCSSPYTFSQLNDVCTMINQNFDNGLYNGGGLICVPTPPAPIRMMPTEATEIEVYPNPNSGSFTTSFEVDRTTDVELVLTDLSGKLLRVIQRNVEPGLYEDTELSSGLELTPGIYLVRFREGDKPAVTRKVIVAGE